MSGDEDKMRHRSAPCAAMEGNMTLTPDNDTEFKAMDVHALTDTNRIADELHILMHKEECSKEDIGRGDRKEDENRH